MSIVFRAFLIVAALLVLLLAVRKIRHSKLRVNDALFWFCFLLVLLLLGIFPQIAFFFSNLLDIESPTNLVFLVVIAVLVIRDFLTTAKLSDLRRRTDELSQAVALRDHDRHIRK